MQSWNQNAIVIHTFWNDRIYLKMAKCVCLAWKLQYLPGAGIGATWKSQIWQPWVFRTLPSDALRFTLHCKTLRWDTYKPVKYSEIRGGVHCDEIQYSEIRSCALRWDTLCRRAASPHGALMLWRGATCSRVKNSPQCSRDCGCRALQTVLVLWTEPQYSTLGCWMACMSGTWLVRLMLILIYTQLHKIHTIVILIYTQYTQYTQLHTIYTQYTQ